MGASTFIMVLIGCSNGGQQCTPIATLPSAYRSEATCLGARAEIVAASSELGFDRVIAECRPRSGGPRNAAARTDPSA